MIHTPLITTASEQRQASLYLLLSTVFWGCSFTWAKTIGDVANQQLGMSVNHPAGPVLMLALRFTLAAAVFIAIFPPARKGWNRLSVRRGMMIGLLLFLSMTLQMLGLDRTSAAVAAFLTALTVLFVPILSLLIFRIKPSPVLWLGVIVATLGIWMLTGATPSGFGLGEVLGLACAIAFSFYILTVNALVPRDSTFRLTALSLLMTGLLCFALAAALIVPSGKMDWRLPIHPQIWPRLLLLVLFCTVAAFGILGAFQPKLDATRASLIYLIEPIIAAVYDYLEQGKTLLPIAIAGATLILAANALVEIIGIWTQHREAQTPHR